MKSKHGVFLGFAVLLIAAIFTLAGCDTGTNGNGYGGGGSGGGGSGGSGGGGSSGGGEDPPPKVVEAGYRFTLDLIIGESVEPSATFTLGENSIVWTKIDQAPELDESYTLTGVYTTGGGTYTWVNGGETGGGDWAYLYDGTGKRGFVMIETEGDDEGYKVVAYGSNVDADNFSGSFSIYTFTPAYDPAGIIAEPFGEYGNH
jgi:hypothetical protein